MNLLFKKSGEKFPVYENFAVMLGSGESVTSITVTSTNTATGADSTSTIISSSTIQSPKVQVIVQAGNQGETHKIEIKATTSASNLYESEIALIVDNGFLSGRVFMQPSEIASFSIDFGGELDGADTFPAGSSGLSVTATKDSDGSAASIVNGTPTITGTVATANFDSTVNGESYRVRYQATSVAGYIYMADILLSSVEV